MKKFIFPILIIGEWILYFYAILLVLGFHLVNVANVIYVETPGEEPILITTSISSFVQAGLLVLGLSVACFLYIKYFDEKGWYKRIKVLAWGMLFALNLIGCLGYLWIWYGFDGMDLRNTDFILLSLVIFVSLVLLIHMIRKLSFKEVQ
ncbi:hypothetical protein ACIQ34_10105 [Ureibacillus sp. NPDC094379]